jgi:uncharacterized damage-inducible protein DinB
MTLREFYLQRHKAELPAFMKVLRALPENRLEYTPHDRSPSARDIVWTMAQEVKVCVDVLTTNRGEWTATPAPPFEEMLALFERSSNAIAEQAARINDAAWERNAEFYFGGKKVSEQPVGRFLWFILFDAIHHRGQLTTYLRPMGGKVPAVYGPSADGASVRVVIS